MSKHKPSKLSLKVKNLPLQYANFCVAGLDIGMSSIFACAGLQDGFQEIREFPTFTADLKDLINWLKQRHITSVAMESTGVYWIPIYDMLAEAGFEVLLVNAYHYKDVSAQKTDIKDCQWIQQLHAYGILKPSFRPDNECVALRGFVRLRTGLFESAAIKVQQMHKALTQMNIQLNLVLSDITGATGMRIIKSILSGQHNPQVLAKLRDSRCKQDEEEIAKALEGNFRPELLFALKQSLEAYEFFHQQILQCETEIQKILEKWNERQKFSEPNESDESSKSNELNKRISKVSEPSKASEQPHPIYKRTKNGNRPQKKTAFNRSPYHFNAADALKKTLGVDLTEIPGIDANTAMKIIAETGTDMSAWKSEKHFCSWLGLCPFNKISGGKVLSSKTKPSNNKAAQALRLAASTLHHSKSALGAYYRRMRMRLGAPKAITAVAHKLAKILYSMIKNRQSFLEAGQEAYEREYRERCIANLTRRAHEMGFELTEIKPKPV